MLGTTKRTIALMALVLLVLTACGVKSTDQPKRVSSSNGVGGVIVEEAGATPASGEPTPAEEQPASPLFEDEPVAPEGSLIVDSGPAALDQNEPPSDDSSLIQDPPDNTPEVPGDSGGTPDAGSSAPPVGDAQAPPDGGASAPPTEADAPPSDGAEAPSEEAPPPADSESPDTGATPPGDGALPPDGGGESGDPAETPPEEPVEEPVEDPAEEPAEDPTQAPVEEEPEPSDPVPGDPSIDSVRFTNPGNVGGPTVIAYSQGATEVCVSFMLSGITDDSQVEIEWFVSGVSEGRFAQAVSAADGEWDAACLTRSSGFPTGTVDFRIEFEGLVRVPQAGVGTGVSELTFINDSATETICTVNISGSDSTKWGADDLAGSLAPGEQATFLVPAGMSDVRVKNCDGEVLDAIYDTFDLESVYWLTYYDD